MPAGATYDSIATTTLSSTQSTIDFTSISGSYTDLVLVVTSISSTGGDVWVRVNDDTASNYSYTVLYANTSSTGSANDNSVTSGLITDYYGSVENANNQLAVIQFYSYANTSTFKTILSRANRANNGVDLICAMWRSTSAITKLTLRFNSGSFGIGTTATLYGITAA
jgi:hypothetical protein